MGYETVHYYKYGDTSKCVEAYQYVPDGDGLRSQITNLYKTYFGRYGEPGGVEGYVAGAESNWGGAGLEADFLKNAEISGEGPTIAENGKHTGLTPGSCPVKGCTDSKANNYDSNADVDDGSCTYDPPTVSISLSQSWIVNTGTQSSTLSWSTGGGPIDSTSAPSKGSKSPTSTTTYTITATGPGGTASASTTLTVYQPPTISLSLSQSWIVNTGAQSSELSWSVSGDTSSTTIDQGLGSVTDNGSTDVSPSLATTYNATTTLKDPNGGTYSDSDSVTLTVYQPPTISLSLSQSWIVNTGTQSTDLSWSTTGDITTTTINQGIGSVANNDSTTISPTVTTTYTGTTTFEDPNGGNYPDSDSITLTVYQPPVITLTLGSSSIIFGGSTTLSWDVVGDTTTTSIDQGIGTVPNNGSETINPTVSTTYTGVTTFVDPNEDTYSDSDDIRLIVYQLPTLDISLPTDVNYGEDITLEYEYEYANISAKVTPQYRYRNANNDGFVNVTGDTVDLTPLSTSAEYDVDGTLVADKSVVLSPVYNDDGPFEINYTVEVKGDGGTETITEKVVIKIDLTPDNIPIPDTVGEKDEEPVYTPDPDEYPDTVLEVTDVDIPVEVKSNAPIKVSKDGGNTWLNVREKT